MSKLSALTIQRDELLEKLREIEQNCEGIENENNAQRIYTLNLEKGKLVGQKKVLSAKLAEVEEKLMEISRESAILSSTGIDRILEAIKGQRWYFFKNKPKILMDRNTGLLWANLDSFPFVKNDQSAYMEEEIVDVIKKNNFDNIGGFRLPDCYELWDMIEDKTFPFQRGANWQICEKCYFFLNKDNSIKSKDLDDKGATYNVRNSRAAALLPCSSLLVDNTQYKNNINTNNHVYTEKERLQFTLDLFVQNGLWPIFEEDEITQLYKKIYVDKPILLEKLQELQTQIEALETVSLLSSEFDYTVLLSKYDLKAIDTSVIKYYEAIQQWINDLMSQLEYYEQKKEEVIQDFNLISLKLSKKYEINTNLTEEENRLLEERQKYFQKKLSLGMNQVKSKLLAIKKQANILEDRIDEINEGDDAITKLAALEREQRASFAFIAENTAKILKNALIKIEYFESNHAFVMHAIRIWEEWTEDYKIFKTTFKEDLKNICEQDSIEEEVWKSWYQDWQQVRFTIEQKIEPIIERGLKGMIPTNDKMEESIIEQVIKALYTYKKSVDTFYLEEKKGIYQKYVFQVGGALQDKFETESELYKCTFNLQTALQEIIFNCKNVEDRIFILKWANSLLDIQIDEILSFIANEDLQKISKAILEEFARLKQANFEVYLTDAKAYGEEKARREKQYNALVFKMRKELMKK